MATIFSPVSRLELVKLAIAGSGLFDTDVGGLDSQQLQDDHTAILVNNGAARLFQVMLTIPRPDSGGCDVTATLAFLNTYFPRLCWDGCLEVCTKNVRQNDYHSLFTCKAITLLTHSVSTAPHRLNIRSYPIARLQMEGAQAQAARWTVADFQAHTQQRIQKHAERVQSFQLAAAPLVQRDIERTITAVWESLPSSFGAQEVEYPSDARVS